MQVIKKEEAVTRAMEGDHVYILMPIDCMSIKELGERTKAGAVFTVLEGKTQPISQEKSKVVPPPPHKRGVYDIEGIMRLYDAGWMYKDIAVEKNLTLEQVKSVIYRQSKLRKKKEAEKEHVH